MWKLEPMQSITGKTLSLCAAVLGASLSMTSTSQAVPATAVHDLTVLGTDAIFLAGRSDVSIPAVGDGANWMLLRHGPEYQPLPESLTETMPQHVSVLGGDSVFVTHTGGPGVDVYPGVGNRMLGPDGGEGMTHIGSLEGISGYFAPRFAGLVGVFLTDENPAGELPPATLNFFTIGTDFLSLAPQLNQVFFIGNGRTSLDEVQTFIAPTGATRLYFGLTDGFGSVGNPGAYEDNDGYHTIRVSLNGMDPQPEADQRLIAPTPEPVTATLAGIALAGLAASATRRRGRA